MKQMKKILLLTLTLLIIGCQKKDDKVEPEIVYVTVPETNDERLVTIQDGWFTPDSNQVSPFWSQYGPIDGQTVSMEFPMFRGDVIYVYGSAILRVYDGSPHPSVFHFSGDIYHEFIIP